VGSFAGGEKQKQNTTQKRSKEEERKENRQTGAHLNRDFSVGLRNG
jgi:hypothetical protein